MPSSWTEVLKGNEPIGRRDAGKVAGAAAIGTDLTVGNRHTLRPLRWTWDRTAGRYEIRRRNDESGYTDSGADPREPKARILNPEDGQAFTTGDTVDFDVHVNAFDEDADIILEYGDETDSEQIGAGESELYQRALDDVTAGEIDFGVTVETPTYEVTDSVSAVVRDAERELSDICEAYSNQDPDARRDLENALGRAKEKSVFDDLTVQDSQAGYFLRDRDRTTDYRPLKLDGSPGSRSDVAGFDTEYAELMNDTAQADRSQLLADLEDIYDGNCSGR